MLGRGQAVEQEPGPPWLVWPDLPWGSHHQEGIGDVTMWSFDIELPAIPEYLESLYSESALDVALPESPSGFSPLRAA